MSEDPLEAFWSNILSEDPEKIIAAWETLIFEEQVAVHAHLVKMATEDGWTEGQRQAAQAALDALRDREPRRPPEDENQRAGE